VNFNPEEITTWRWVKLIVQNLDNIL
jgi:hypothetical protein